jgi:hypothetical protein
MKFYLFSPKIIVGSMLVLSSNWGNASDSDYFPPLKLGETVTYEFVIDSQNQTVDEGSFTTKCVAKVKRHGMWFFKCIQGSIGGNHKHIHYVRLNSQGVDTAENEAKRAEVPYPIKLGITRSMEKAPNGKASLKRTIVEYANLKKDGKEYRHCLHYREERYNCAEIRDVWLAPGLGAVKAGMYYSCKRNPVGFHIVLKANTYSTPS